jgi:nucleotide-binding universal stress UspA family protein
MGSVTARVIGHALCNILVVPKAATIEYKNILLATDGSKYSDAAAGEAICIAKCCKCGITAVSVAAKDADIVEAKLHLDKVGDLADREGITVDAVTVTGSPAESILAIAKQKNADLIVVGSHGRTGVERLLMGSVTERVIGEATASVLVVKS